MLSHSVVVNFFCRAEYHLAFILLLNVTESWKVNKVIIALQKNIFLWKIALEMNLFSQMVKFHKQNLIVHL